MAAVRGVSTALAAAAPELKHGLDKIGGRAAWTGAQLAASPWWGRSLSAGHIAELDSALKDAMQSGKIDWEGEVPLAVSPFIFHLSEEGMGGLLRDMANELEDGTGATMLQGIPVERYSLAELSVLYLGMCGYVGNIVNQSSAGLRSKSRGYGMPVGHVKAEMRGKTPKDGKQVGPSPGRTGPQPPGGDSRSPHTPPSPPCLRPTTTSASTLTGEHAPALLYPPPQYCRDGLSFIGIRRLAAPLV